MNLTQLQAVIAPVLTPAAPAIMLGSQVYAGMVADKIPQAIAIVGAVGSGVGMEFAGSLAFSMGLIALRRRQWIPALLAALGVIGYAGFMLLGISQAVNGVSFLSLVGGSLVAFSAVAVREELSFSGKQKADELTATRTEIDRLDAERKLTNARARADRIASTGVQVSSGRTGRVQLNPELLERVQVYIVDNPGCSARAIALALGISPTTASVYKKHLDTPPK